MGSGEIQVPYHSIDNETINISLTDLNGKTLLQHQFISSSVENIFNLNASHLISGIYRIVIKTSNSVVSLTYIKSG